MTENYLEAKVEDIKELEAGVMNTGNNQNMLDEVYESAVRMVKSSWEAEAQDHSKLDACVAEVVGQWMQVEMCRCGKEEIAENCGKVERWNS